MGKLDDAMSPAGRRRLRPVQAAGDGPKLPKSKKERPASKGRVHKGRTRD